MLLKLTSKVCEQNLKRNVLSLPYQDAVSLWKPLSRDTDLSLEFLCVDSFRFITWSANSLAFEFIIVQNGTHSEEAPLSWDKVMQHSTLSPDCGSKPQLWGSHELTMVNSQHSTVVFSRQAHQSQFWLQIFSAYNGLVLMQPSPTFTRNVNPGHAPQCLRVPDLNEKL